MKNFKFIVYLFPILFIPILIENRPYYIFFTSDVEVDYYWSSYSIYKFGISNSFTHPGFVIQLFGALILSIIELFTDINNIQNSIEILRYVGIAFFLLTLCFIQYQKKYDVRSIFVYQMIFSWVSIYPALLYFGVDTYVLIISIPICIILSKIILFKRNYEVSIPFVALLSVAISIKVIFIPFIFIYAISISNRDSLKQNFIKILIYSIIIFLLINIYQYNHFFEFFYKIIFIKILPGFILLCFLLFYIIKNNYLNLRNILLILSKLFLILNFFIINPLLYFYSIDWSYLRNITPFYILSVFIYFYSIDFSKNNINSLKLTLISLYLFILIFIFSKEYNNNINIQKNQSYHFNLFIEYYNNNNRKLLYWPGSGDHGIIPYDFTSWGWSRYVKKSIPIEFESNNLKLIPLRQLIKFYKRDEILKNNNSIVNKIRKLYLNSFDNQLNITHADPSKFDIIIKCNEISIELFAQGLDKKNENDFLKYFLKKYGIYNYYENEIIIGNSCWKFYKSLGHIK